MTSAIRRESPQTGTLVDPPATEPARPAKVHLYYVDLVRVLTVALVIGVHAIGAGPLYQTQAVGAVEIVFHVSREVFFLLTAFVLTYGSGRPAARGAAYWARFWRRRFLFVGVPYVAWSAVYFLALGHPLTPLGPQARLLGQELLEGTARYHLYFLLVSLQIYLCFPVIRALLNATRRHHGLLLAGCAVFQTLFCWAVQHHWQAGPVLTGWLRDPQALLPSYLGYVLAGAVAGRHRDTLVRWTRAHPRLVAAGCAACVALGVGVYLLQTLGEGQRPTTAAAVFQPVTVAESVAVTMAFLAVGLRWEDRGLPGKRLIRTASDASFGVYLSHPLLLQALFAASAAVGLTPVAQRSGPVFLIALVVVVMPLVYATCALLSAVVRRTPLSLPLTGRAWLRHPLETPPAPSRTAPHGGS